MWAGLAVEGASGGILILWDSRILEMVDSCASSFSISVIFKNIEDGVQQAFSEVYGTNDDSRRLLWEEL